MADKLRKFRKDSYVEKRFGKDINVSTKEDAPLKKDMSAAETKSVEKAKPGTATQTFKEAFAAARKNPEAMKAGKFTWNGKSYSTALASERKAAPTSVRRAAPAARASTPTATSKQVDKPSIPAAAKAVADKAAGYRAAFQRQDGQAGFSKAKTPAPKPPAQDPNWGRKVIAKRDAEAAAKRRFLPDGRLNPAAVKSDGSIDMTYKAKGGKIDGCAVRGKTKAGRKK